MKLSIDIEAKCATFECVDKAFRDAVQSVTDGKKVFKEPRITMPIKCIPKVYNAVIRRDRQDKLEFSDDAKASMMETVDNVRRRKASMQTIRSDYSNGCELDMRGYEIKGKYPPLRHQISMFQAIMDNDSGALLADPGTCKTAPYLWAIDHRMNQGIVKKALIITLSDLKKNVLAEMKVQTPGLKGVILSGKLQSDNVLNKSYKIAKKNLEYDVYISNYESMFSLIDLFGDDYFDMIISDEAHRMGSPKSRQTKSIVGKFDTVPFKYIITGTLSANNHTSFFMPFRFMGPDTIPQANFYEFRRVYFFTVDPNGYIWKPQRGLGSIIQKIIANVSICFTKDECLDLPPIIYQKYGCKMSAEQKKYYKDIKENLVLEIEDMCKKCDRYGKCKMMCDNELMISNILVVITKLSQITCGFYINRVVSIGPNGKENIETNTIILPENPKLDLLISVVNNIPPGKKVILWSRFIYGIRLMAERIEKCFGPDSYITVSGSDDVYDKVQEFKNNPKIRFFIANQVKAGVGQNIQFSCYQYFFANSYSFVQRDQAEGRQHREGQTNKVTVGDVYCEDTIDEEVLTILSDKKNLSNNLNSLAKAVGISKEIKKLKHFKKE